MDCEPSGTALSEGTIGRGRADRRFVASHSTSEFIASYNEAAARKVARRASGIDFHLPE
jgi:hypothetical protein